MTRRLFVLSWLALVVVLPLHALQASQPDPITGVWTGEFVADGGERRVSVRFELKFDGEQKVTGTFTGMPTPGEVRSGSFNRDSGALQLRLSKEGEEEVRIVLEGTVADGAAKGRLSGEADGTFTLTKEKQ